MDHQGFRVANVSKVRQEFDIFDKFLSGRCPALDAERQYCAGAFGQIFLR